MVADHALHCVGERDDVLAASFHGRGWEDNPVAVNVLGLEVLPLSAPLAGNDQEPDKHAIIGKAKACLPYGLQLLIRENARAGWQGRNGDARNGVRLNEAPRITPREKEPDPGESVAPLAWG